MERKKRSKGSVWEFCYANKIFGTFGVEMRSCGQKLVKFCTLTHAAKLVVRFCLHSVGPHVTEISTSRHTLTGTRLLEIRPLCYYCRVFGFVVARTIDRQFRRVRFVH